VYRDCLPLGLVNGVHISINKSIYISKYDCLVQKSYFQRSGNVESVFSVGALSTSCRPNHLSSG
jgi:hypothetical protein